VSEIQMLGNYPEENMQHTEHGESLKSSKLELWWILVKVPNIKFYKNLSCGSRQKTRQD